MAPISLSPAHYHLGALVHQAMTAAGLNQRQLAHLADVHPGTISKLLHGQHQPERKTLQAILGAVRQALVADSGLRHALFAAAADLSISLQWLPVSDPDLITTDHIVTNAVETSMASIGLTISSNPIVIEAILAEMHWHVFNDSPAQDTVEYADRLISTLSAHPLDTSDEGRVLIIEAYLIKARAELEAYPPKMIGRTVRSARKAQSFIDKLPICHRDRERLETECDIVLGKALRIIEANVPRNGSGNLMKLHDSIAKEYGVRNSIELLQSIADRSPDDVISQAYVYSELAKKFSRNAEVDTDQQMESLRKATGFVTKGNDIISKLRRHGGALSFIIPALLFEGYPRGLLAVPGAAAEARAALALAKPFAVLAVNQFQYETTLAQSYLITGGQASPDYEHWTKQLLNLTVNAPKPYQAERPKSLLQQYPPLLKRVG